MVQGARGGALGGSSTQNGSRCAAGQRLPPPRQPGQLTRRRQEASLGCLGRSPAFMACQEQARLAGG